jgi:hypothetical protein
MTGTTSTAVVILCVALPFAWWGAVLAISFLETPLKFRAPGVTVALAVGIGRIVFKALNGVEVCLAVAIVVGLAAAGDPGAPAWTILGVLIATLAGQIVIIRPNLDRRAAVVVAQGDRSGRSHLHLVYVVGEVVKLFALPALAVVVAGRLLS